MYRLKYKDARDDQEGAQVGKGEQQIVGENALCPVQCVPKKGTFHIQLLQICAVLQLLEEAEGLPCLGQFFLLTLDFSSRMEEGAPPLR